MKHPKSNKRPCRWCQRVFCGIRYKKENRSMNNGPEIDRAMNQFGLWMVAGLVLLVISVFALAVLGGAQ